jgi:hypothetical protein
MSEEAGFGEEMPQIRELEGGEVKPGTLREIDSQLYSLMAHVPDVEYTRKVGYSGNSVTLSTSEKMGETHDRGIVLALPYIAPDGPHAHARVRIDGEAGVGGGQIDFVDSDIISPRELLQSPLIPPDLPEGVNALLLTLAQHAEGDGPMRELSEGDQAFGRIWQGITDNLDEAEVPRGYKYEYSTELHGKTAHVSTTNVMPRDDGTLYPEDTLPYTTKTISLDDDFVFDHQRVGGETDMYFRDEALVTDDKLLPLTDEDRRMHPYVVIPSVGDEAKGIDIKPYKVINADAGDSRITITDTNFFETPEEGQAYADKLYQQDIAKSKISRNVTEARAQHVLATLRLIVEKAQSEDMGGGTD